MIWASCRKASDWERFAEWGQLRPWGKSAQIFRRRCGLCRVGSFLALLWTGRPNGCERWLVGALGILGAFDFFEAAGSLGAWRSLRSWLWWPVRAAGAGVLLKGASLRNSRSFIHPPTTTHKTLHHLHRHTRLAASQLSIACAIRRFASAGFTLLQIPRHHVRSSTRARLGQGHV